MPDDEILHPVPAPPTKDDSGSDADALFEPVETETQQGDDEK